MIRPLGQGPIATGTMRPTRSFLSHGAQMRSFGHVTQCAPQRGRSAGVDGAGSGRPCCIGIAESQWDFNDANATPGFGPLRRTERVPALLEQTPGACDEAAAETSNKRRRPNLVTCLPIAIRARNRCWTRCPPSMLICSPDDSSGAGRCGHARSQSRREWPSAKATSARQRYAAVEGFIEGSWENRRNRCAPSLLHALSLVSLAVTVPRSSTHSCSSQHRSHSRNPAYGFSGVLPVSTRTAAASDADDF